MLPGLRVVEIAAELEEDLAGEKIAVERAQQPFDLGGVADRQPVAGRGETVALENEAAVQPLIAAEHAAQPTLHLRGCRGDLLGGQDKISQGLHDIASRYTSGKG